MPLSRELPLRLKTKMTMKREGTESAHSDSEENNDGRRNDESEDDLSEEEESTRKVRVTLKMMTHPPLRRFSS